MPLARRNASGIRDAKCYPDLRNGSSFRKCEGTFKGSCPIRSFTIKNSFSNILDHWCCATRWHRSRCQSDERTLRQLRRIEHVWYPKQLDNKSVLHDWPWLDPSLIPVALRIFIFNGFLRLILWRGRIVWLGPHVHSIFVVEPDEVLSIFLAVL